MNHPYTITPEMIQEFEARWGREDIARAARDARVAEQWRLTRPKRLQKLFANVMRFEPAVVVHEMRQWERYAGYGTDYPTEYLACFHAHSEVVDDLLRQAIEVTGYQGLHDTGDVDAARVHAAQEVNARRQATRTRKKTEAAQAYRAEAVAREMADPRIPMYHKVKVAAGEVEPIILDEDGKPSLDWVLTGAAMHEVRDRDVVGLVLKLHIPLSPYGEMSGSDWIAALPKDTLIPFIDAAPDYIAYLHDIQRLAKTEHNTPSLRVVS